MTKGQTMGHTHEDGTLGAFIHDRQLAGVPCGGGKHEYGTPLPDLSAVNNKAEELEQAGFAIYEVKVETDNGGWAVYFYLQDDELDESCLAYLLDANGGMTTNGRLVEAR